MKIKTTLPITEARKNIFNIAEEVQKTGVYYTLTEHGRPKMVMLSAEKFEALTEQKNNNFICADKSQQAYGMPREMMLSKVLVVRDESRVVYLSGDDKNLRYKEESLIKSQLYIKLIEKCKYSLGLIEFGRYVKVGGEKSRHYIEADIIINDGHGNVRMIFEVGLFDEYEKSLDQIMADLFDISSAVAWVKKPEFLVYYSRSCKSGIVKEKILVVDCSKFNTFSAWKKAGRPGDKTIPEFC